MARRCQIVSGRCQIVSGRCHIVLRSFQMVSGQWCQEGVSCCKVVSGGFYSGRWEILVGKVLCWFPNQNLLKSMLPLVNLYLSYYLFIYMMKVSKGYLNFYSRCPGLNFKYSWCPGIVLPKTQFFFFLFTFNDNCKTYKYSLIGHGFISLKKHLGALWGEKYVSSRYKAVLVQFYQLTQALEMSTQIPSQNHFSHIFRWYWEPVLYF